MIFGKGENLCQMMDIFLGHSWIFELNHNVFELGHLNSINILNAPKILVSIVGFWNNPNNVHNGSQKFLK